MSIPRECAASATRKWTADSKQLEALQELGKALHARDVQSMEQRIVTRIVAYQ
jgi:hypothetical protein